MRRLVDHFGEGLLRRCPGFTDKNDRLTFWTSSGQRDGYVVPYRDERDRITGLQAKLLGGKYLTARGTRVADVHHLAGAADGDLYLTEGATKANIAHHTGGLWVFAVPGQSLAPQHVEAIRGLQPERAIVALDREDNANTDRARERWLRMLWAVDLPVYEAVWEGEDVGGPKGLDDLVAGGGRPRVRGVAFAPSEIGNRRRVLPSVAPGPVAEGGTIYEARELTAKAVDGFLRHTRRNAGRALLVRTPPGAGKTYAVGQTAAAHGIAARIVVGTTRLAREVAAEFGYRLIEGRNERNCERFQVVRALGEAGHEVERLACGKRDAPRCPFRAACPYWRQFDIIGPRVGAAEQLFNPRFLQGGSAVVVDDADLLRSLLERLYVDETTLGQVAAQLKGRRRKPARRLLTLLHHAVLDAPRRQDGLPGPALLGARLWDHLARTARRYEEDLGELIDALPARGSLPEPKAADGEGLTVEDILNVPPAAIFRLIEAMRQELPSFRSGDDFNSRLRLDVRGIEVVRLREHVRDRLGVQAVGDMALLVLEATPVDALVDHLTALHKRDPDVEASVRLPQNVTVVQYAGSTNSHTVLQDGARLRAALAEVQAERERSPVARPDEEAAVCFKAHRRQFVELGFAESQALNFGAVRGLNALANVRRLHVLGRPMPPGDDLVYLAQAVHHEEGPVSHELRLEARRFGGQAYEVDVLDFADPRVAALLRATREDEMVQVIHRARLLTLEAQQELFGAGRGRVRLVLHTAHVVPGLRVDELHVEAVSRDVNEERSEEAERRIVLAAEELRARGAQVTVTAVAKAAGAHKSTVTRVLGTPVHTLRRDPLYKGVNHCPQTDGRTGGPSPSSSVAESVAPDEDGRVPCLGGCGRTASPGGKCRECAAAAVVEWKQRKRKVGAA